jgi:SPP1 family predicted phage head-tail adaptor
MAKRGTIGEKNRALSLQRPTGTSGYTTVDTVWGSLVLAAPGAQEALNASTPTTTTVFESRIWYRTDVRADWRVVDEDGRQFQIGAYGDPDGRRLELLLTLSEIQ